jgi:hypothetical protein
MGLLDQMATGDYPCTALLIADCGLTRERRSDKGVPLIEKGRQLQPLSVRLSN